MPILIQCPICSAKFKAPDHAAGMTVPCAKCGGQIGVPGGKAKPKPPTGIDFSTVVATEQDARARQQAFVTPDVRVEDDDPAESRLGLWLALAGVAVLLILAWITAMLLINSGVLGGGRHSVDTRPPHGARAFDDALQSLKYGRNARYAGNPIWPPKSPRKTSTTTTTRATSSSAAPSRMSA